MVCLGTSQRHIVYFTDADGKVDIWERVAPALEEEDDGESDSPPTEE